MQVSAVQLAETPDSLDQVEDETNITTTEYTKLQNPQFTPFPRFLYIPRLS